MLKKISTQLFLMSLMIFCNRESDCWDNSHTSLSHKIFILDEDEDYVPDTDIWGDETDMDVDF